MRLHWSASQKDKCWIFFLSQVTLILFTVFEPLWIVSPSGSATIFTHSHSFPRKCVRVGGSRVSSSSVMLTDTRSGISFTVSFLSCGVSTLAAFPVNNVHMQPRDSAHHSSRSFVSYTYRCSINLAGWLSQGSFITFSMISSKLDCCFEVSHTSSSLLPWPLLSEGTSNVVMLFTVDKWQREWEVVCVTLPAPPCINEKLRLQVPSVRTRHWGAQEKRRRGW